MCNKCRRYFRPEDLFMYHNYKYCEECYEAYKIYKVRKHDFIEV